MSIFEFIRLLAIELEAEVWAINAEAYRELMPEDRDSFEEFTLTPGVDYIMGWAGSSVRLNRVSDGTRIL